MRVSVVSVGIRDYNLRYYGHQITLKTPTNITLEIYEAACRAFDESWDGIPIRHLGVHTSHVSYDSSRQATLFDTTDYEKLERLDKAVDSLRKRFGNDSIKRATFVKSPNNKVKTIDHMSGGISREKRTVDYSKQEII